MKIPLLFILAASIVLGAVDLNKPIPEMNLKDGRTIKNVVIVSFGSSTVMAKWDGGRGTIPIAELPEGYATIAKARTGAVQKDRESSASHEPNQPSDEGLIPVLTLANGTVFKNVSIARYDREKVVLNTSAGQTALPYSYFPEDMRHQMLRERDSALKVREEIAKAERVKAAAEAVEAQNAILRKAQQERAMENFRAQVREEIRGARLLVGMTESDVMQSWGAPNRRNTSSDATLDQWVYERPEGKFYVYFTRGILKSWDQSEYIRRR